MSHQPKLSGGMRLKHLIVSGYRRATSEAGSGLVEYAVIFMLFMTMMLGIADFGRALYADHYVSDAARETSRWAAVNGSACANDSSCAAPATTSDIQNHAKQNVPSGIDPTKLNAVASFTTSPSCTTASNTPGCGVDVQVQYTFNFAFPFVSKQTLTLSSESQTIIVH